MGRSLRMRRVPANELQRGSRFWRTDFRQHCRTIDREVASGSLCSLGEVWCQMNVLLTGEYYPDGPASLPVLGGAHVASLDLPIDTVIWLDADGVRDAHVCLSGVDFDDYFERHREKLEFYGILFLEPELRRLLGEMQRFYALAAAAGEAVAKRAYA
jgi:hypothetical protein